MQDEKNIKTKTHANALGLDVSEATQQSDISQQPVRFMLHILLGAENFYIFAPQL
jgi:hypothetical protein